MNEFIHLLASGLALGAVYALVALGFVVIYRSSKVFNFAQGELLTLGAFLVFAFAQAGLPWGIAAGLAIVATGVVGVGIERAALRPLVGKPVFVTIIVTIFVGVILRLTIQLIWGNDPRPMPTPWELGETVEIGGANVLVSSLVAIAAVGVVLAVFFVVIKRTKLGIAMRATANDQETALALGIPVGRVFAMSWFIAGAFAALGGMFLAMYPSAVEMRLSLDALQAFPAVIVGGLESPTGSVIAGFLLGLCVVFGEVLINPLLGEFGHGFHLVFPYVVMILFLVVRPRGIFGTPRIERV